MNFEGILKYLSWPHVPINDDPCALAMDSFPGPVTEPVYTKGGILAIEIIPVAKGLTGEYQPSDLAGFGPRKRTSRSQTVSPPE
jgi:hypothetical protein